MAASSLECRAATARRYACTSHEDGASRVRAPGVLMPHAWGLLPPPAPLRRPLQVRLACHAACSAAVRHEVSRHCLLLSCTHVALTVLLSFICQVLQGREGARHQREIQEWPFPGVSLSRVLGRSRGACVRVCCVPPMPARFQARWRVLMAHENGRKSCCAHARENFLRLRRWEPAAQLAR